MGLQYLPLQPPFIWPAYGLAYRQLSGFLLLTGTILAFHFSAYDALIIPIMKRYFFRTLFFSWLLLLGVGAAHAQADNLAPVRSALRNGSSRELSQYLAPTIEVGFDGDKQGYNAAQAEIVIKDFFTKNTPSAFEFIHQGESKEGIQYAIGRYTGRNGTYRVFVKLKPSRGAPLIDTLDFTKE